jgi:ABC-type Zn uptake system ZnuABC Zn-binding protein ZnuA
MSIENPKQEAKNIDNQIAKMSDEKKDEILSNFKEFKSYLGDKIEWGKKLNLSEETLAKGAEKAANYLANHEEPRNREEYLLRELWKVGTEEEQHKLAHMLVKIVDDEK